MYRVSTTDLEAFRRIVQSEYGNEADLIAKLMGKPAPSTIFMDAGKAWHACIEGKGEGTHASPAMVQSGGYFFARAAVELAQKVVGPGLCEVKAVKNIDGVDVVAQADHVGGLVVTDHKAKFSPVDVRAYERSLQWKLYLLVHEAACFVYRCWEFKEPDGGMYCELRNVQSFRFWPYPQMEADCRSWLKSFVAWADQHHLLPYLDRPGSAAA